MFHVLAIYYLKLFNIDVTFFDIWVFLGRLQRIRFSVKYQTESGTEKYER